MIAAIYARKSTDQTVADKAEEDPRHGGPGNAYA